MKEEQVPWSYNERYQMIKGILRDDTISDAEALERINFIVSVAVSRSLKKKKRVSPYG